MTSEPDSELIEEGSVSISPPVAGEQSGEQTTIKERIESANKNISKLKDTLSLYTNHILALDHSIEVSRQSFAIGLSPTDISGQLIRRAKAAQTRAMIEVSYEKQKQSREAIGLQVRLTH